MDAFKDTRVLAEAALAVVVLLRALEVARPSLRQVRYRRATTS
jgi:hypothetical protein